MSTAPNATFSPAAQIIAEAEATFPVADTLGRRITVRRPTALDKLRLFKAVGPLLAQNAPYFGLAMLAACVTAIDDVPVPMAATEALIENTISRLGDPGIAAVAAALKPAESKGDHAGN